MLSPNAHILYVDDNKDSCELAAAMFNCSDLGCVMTSAGSAEEALRLIEVEPFDLYIFDYRLPKISGVELCRYIRQYDADTPIVFFTAAARAAEQTEAMAAGATEYLVKPNDLERLTGTVKRLLNENSTMHNAEASIKTKAYSGIY